MKKFTFSFDLFSDFHKDAYGFRPRGHEFYNPDTTDERRQEIWDFTGQALEDSIEREKLQELASIKYFKDTIQKTIEFGAKDEAEALRWMSQTETFYHSQDVEHWVWENGILFTDYGQIILKKLFNIVEYSNWS